MPYLYAHSHGSKATFADFMPSQKREKPLESQFQNTIQGLLKLAKPANG
jgi:hypothetical protein